MNDIGILALVAAMTLASTLPAAGQHHQGFENECDSFHNATPADLLSFLNATTPDEKNGDCVTWAIKRLGRERFEPSIPALIRLLDFRRPRERCGCRNSAVGGVLVERWRQGQAMVLELDHQFGQGRMRFVPAGAGKVDHQFHAESA